MLLAATFALAQTGSIQGTVTDSAGAVVQGAEITVKNLGSNALRTDDQQRHREPSASHPLLPASYEITVKMASFKTFHVDRYRALGRPSASLECCSWNRAR